LHLPNFGGKMDFLTNLIDGVTSINWEVIAQLLMLALIVIAGPVVIFLLAALRGNL
jgi:Photosystem II complex subunit Ycf12